MEVYMFKHYIWDFDGTLFNSYPHMVRAFQMALRDFSIEESSEDILTHMKISVTAALEFYKNKYELDDELRIRYSMYEREGDKSLIVPYPNAAEVCRKICEKGGFNYLYTHRDMAAREYLRQFGMEECFRDFITSQDPFPAKPAPDAILYLVDKYNMDKKTVLMIGDRDIDILAGYNAGVEGCLFDPQSFYQGFEVKYRVHSMGEFEKKFLLTSR